MKALNLKRGVRLRNRRRIKILQGSEDLGTIYFRRDITISYRLDEMIAHSEMNRHFLFAASIIARIKREHVA